MAATFTVLDYCLFIAVLLISALIGVFYMIRERRQAREATAEDILMGGREMGIFPVAMSLLASYMSAITVLGIPTEIYAYGTGYWLVAASGLLTFPATCFVFLPFFHNMKLDSAYQYLELRFNRATRCMASLLFVLEMLFYMAVVLYAPALALNEVTGLSLWGSILAVGAVVTFYTSMGGLPAVLWTDTFQTFVVVLGLIGIIVTGSQQQGGLSAVWEAAKEGGRINFFNFDPSPFSRVTVWGAVIGSFIGQLTIYGASPTMLQRYMAIRDVRNSQRDQILPYFVMENLGSFPGAPGLFVSCIFAAALSSVSSVLNALSITVLEDLVKPWMDSRGSHLSPRGEANLAKILGVCGGLAVIALAFLASVLGHTVLEIMITARGIGGGQLLGLFLLGMFFPCVNSAGAVAGFVVSSICTFWVAIGAIVLRVPQPTLPFSTAGCLAPSYSLLGDDNFNLITDLRFEENIVSGFNQIYTLSFLWYPTLAVIVSLVVGILKVRGPGDFLSDTGTDDDDEAGNDGNGDEAADTDPIVVARGKKKFEGFVKDTRVCFEPSFNTKPHEHEAFYH
ncbi:hypothetical protein BaRGS_00020684 [Batillaria attramentaria]|uniref:Sodium-dependent multivitamin transporter n=1 Tax=Batillaria attramentaria TaxID=370345 RepID=A0ABD0KLI5_9CAEN